MMKDSEPYKRNKQGEVIKQMGREEDGRFKEGGYRKAFLKSGH